MTSPITRTKQLVRALARPAMFAGVGAANTAVDLAMFGLLIGPAALPPLYANFISFTLGALNSFFLNTLITFRDRPLDRWTPQRLLRFMLVTFFSLALSSVVLATSLVILPPLAAKVASVIVVFAASYLLSTSFVFRAEQAPPLGPTANRSAPTRETV